MVNETDFGPRLEINEFVFSFIWNSFVSKINDASRVTSVKFVFRYPSQGNEEEVKRNILLYSQVSFSQMLTTGGIFHQYFYFQNLRMTGRIRWVYDRKGNKQLYSKPRKSTSARSLFMCFVIYRTQNPVCQCTLMDITHNGYLKIDGVDCSGVKDKAANLAKRKKAD